MAGKAQFGSAALSAMRAAIRGAGDRLDQYLADPAPDARLLEAAGRELHGLPDALKEARLDGVAVFCAELESALGWLASRPDAVSGAHHDVLRRALSAVTRYLDALANGADNAALRLFPQYRELRRLRGLEPSSELDLFYPDLAVQLPQEVLGARPARDTGRYAGAAVPGFEALRSLYQQGLMRWLRREDARAALQLMQRALDDVLRLMPQDGSRAFWWVAGGLLDCLESGGLPPELDARKLLGRIDRQIRAVAEGDAGDVRQTMNEMLYLIGRSHTVSGPVETIKQVYALDRYLPDLPASPPAETAQIPGVMRDQLRAAEESWERCAQGDAAACGQFIGHAGQLVSQSEKLDSDTLRHLAGQIQTLALHADVPERARPLATEMAMALLLLGGGIERYGKPDNGFREQVRLMSGRLQAAAAGQPEDERSLAELVDLHCRMERDDAVAALYDEMLADLQHVGYGLSAFSGDAAKRGEPVDLLRLLDRIQGGLRILSLEQAARLLVSVRDSLRHFARGDVVPAPMENRALTDAVGALENYVQHLKGGRAGDVSPLQAASDSLDNLDGPRRAHGQMAPPAGIEAQYPAGENRELLEVFLEEAQEVLHTLRDNLQICRLHPGSREPLAAMKRGFHTLKGSARMVGLDDLGEAAWHVERALNTWLLGGKPATGGLLYFIGEAVQRFTGWVGEPDKARARIGAGELIAAAQRIEEGFDPDMKEGAVVVAGEIAPDAGGRLQVCDDIDEQLLPVFLEEADDLCSGIDAGLLAWRAQPGGEQPLQLLKRLLHTLKGSARMTGAMRIGEAAHEMEGRVLATAQMRGQAGCWDALENDFDRITGLLEALRGDRPGEAGAGRRATDKEDAGCGAERALRGSMLRVRSDVLDRLVSVAGEAGASRSHLEAEMRAFREGLLELGGSVARLRDRLREMETRAGGGEGPRGSERWLEQVRFMGESVHDVQAAQQSLLKNIGEAEAALSLQTRLDRELQQGLIGVRRIPFASIGERLYRIVRQTAKELNKRANLELTGTDVELDRGVLERMTAPFEHLLRNAMVHGLEDGQTRSRAGKDRTGEICLDLRQEDGEVVFTFSDDGAGLNFEALREKALAAGLLQPGEAAGDDQLAQLIFEPGISTAAEVTEVAGRGIGMDVVRSEVAALGGRIEVGSKRGQGTQFTIRLPRARAPVACSGDAAHAASDAVVEHRAGAVPEASRAHPLVMVVDDSPSMRKMTTSVLAHAGYRVVTARDGADALEQLGGGIRPSVMLLDIEMPQMDGFELVGHLRRDAGTRGLPIIMTTSRAPDQYRDHALQLGVNACLDKPYQDEDLLQLVAGLILAHEAG